MKCFPDGVVEVRVDKQGIKVAEVVNPRLDTVSREVLRHDEFKDKVKLGRVRDHFICTSTLDTLIDMTYSLYRKYGDLATRHAFLESDFRTKVEVSETEIGD